MFVYISGVVNLLRGLLANSEGFQTMFSPLVYNTSCLSISNGSNFESIALTSYDLFRCAVVILVTLGLILGNSVLALAVNSKYSAGILQFQVSTRFIGLWTVVHIWLLLYLSHQSLCTLYFYSCSRRSINPDSTRIRLQQQKVVPYLFSCIPLSIKQKKSILELSNYSRQALCSDIRRNIRPASH